MIKRFCFASLLIWTLNVAFAESFDRAPDFSIPDIYSGERISLKDYRGRVVLVDFWASWCGPCQASLPAYNDLRNRLVRSLPEAAFEVLAINVDVTKKEAMGFLNKHPLDIPVLLETTGKSQQNYELIALPTSYLIDQQGMIRISHQGFEPGYIQYLEKEIYKMTGHVSRDESAKMPLP